MQFLYMEKLLTDQCMYDLPVSISLLPLNLSTLQYIFTINSYKSNLLNFHLPLPLRPTLRHHTPVRTHKTSCTFPYLLSCNWLIFYLGLVIFSHPVVFPVFLVGLFTFIRLLDEFVACLFSDYLPCFVQVFSCSFWDQTSRRCHRGGLCFIMEATHHRVR
jgi:hypothetical protein